MDNIERLNHAKTKGCLLSLDIKKAFDSLSHSYLNSVYTFYNFGPKLKKWLTILCTNRKACVIIDGTYTTDFFNLERGNAQGDTISPFLFNLGYQILLFKLELSLQIFGILSDFAGGPEQVAQGQVHAHGVLGHIDQVRLSDPKAFALADDCSLIVRMDVDNLQNILNVLSDFESISGLGCNLEKTALMQVGSELPVPQEIINMGFEIKDEITLLGAKIQNRGVCYAANPPIILQKIRKQGNFWKRFNLSLPGRINVAKTFLYSQINYLGCFMPLTRGEICEISREIESFVCGKLKISKHRIYQKKCEGGLELIDVQDYISSQTISWLRRAYSNDDLWKYQLFNGSHGSVFNLRKSNFDKKMSPILYNIADQAEKFVYSFTARNENYKKAWLFDNPSITFEINRQHYLKKTFFTMEEWTLFEGSIKMLTMDNILNADGTVKSKIEFENGTGVLLSEIKYNKLRGMALSSVRKYAKNALFEKKTDTVQNFLMRIKKGSKTIRKIIQGTHNCVVSANILKYAELTENFINAEESRILNGSWGPGYLHNSTRTFIFKLHNNTLGLNSRVAHFVRNHPSTCTFCDINGIPEENLESTKHLFFDCPSVENLITDFYTWVLSEEQPRYISRKEFFVGFNFDCENKNKVLHLINLLVKKFIWECKLRFTLPALVDLKNTVASEMHRIFHTNSRMRKNITRSNFFTNHEIRF